MDTCLTESQVICARHFLDNDIQKTDVFHLKNGAVESIPRIRWRLRPDALPKFMDIENDDPVKDCEREGDELFPATDVILKPYELHETCQLHGEPTYFATIKEQKEREQVELREMHGGNDSGIISDNVENEVTSHSNNHLSINRYYHR